ncbi:JAB domain-containing protein [Bacillus cereus]|uniref:JAB domain-containing protein n=1 Tax=Bacillus cereus TaxID=1396 RepID=UPI0009ADE6F7|nr:hypothetical protein [Bacillus cereus]HDR4548698.1 hypothetical protein [Bacillus cereus]
MFASLGTKNWHLSINIFHIGNLNYSMVHLHEVIKSVILSNVDLMIVDYNYLLGTVTLIKEDIEITKGGKNE